MNWIIFFSLILLNGCLTTRSQLKSQEAPREGAVLIEEGTSSKGKSHVEVPLQESSQSSGIQNPELSKAELHLKVQEYEEQIRKLQGQVETLEYEKKQKEQSSSLPQSADLSQLKTYEEALVKMQEEIDHLKLKQQGNQGDAKKTTDESLRPSEGVSEKKGVSPEPVATSKTKTEETTSGVVTKKTKPLSDFEVAEGFFDQKEWKKAIIQYQKYRDTNSKGLHYPLATYKIGVCFQELGLKEEAKSFFKEVMDKYPSSKEYKKARFRYNQL